MKKDAYGELQRVDELDRKEPGLLRKILRAGPITVFTRVARLAEEGANLVSKVLLVRVELMTARIL